MSARDEKNDNQASTDPLADGVHRRSFLKYLGAVFSAAALPDAISACGAPAGATDGTLGETESLINLASSPMIWVTRKQDGLSLGFQFVNIVADANHNIALSSGARPGSAYVAITFPPQHVMEDAIKAAAFPGYPLNARASAPSRIVFNVPAAYGAAAAGDAGGIAILPYTLQGMLALCASSAPVVAPNAMTTAGTYQLTGQLPILEAEKKYESLSQARIDRVIARVDPKAAARVRRRAVRASRMLDPDRAVLEPVRIESIQITHTGTVPVTPTSAQTSIELPFRVQMSPNEEMRWSFQSAPVASPSTLGVDAARTELWHARMCWADAAGVADPSIGGLTLRALYTRDWDVYGVSQPAGTGGTYLGNLPEPVDGGVSPYTNDPVANANPTAPNREALVLLTGNMAGASFAPINVNRLILSPIGGTLDASLSGGTTSGSGVFTPTTANPADLVYWKQDTVLGRDEFVECVNAVTVLPGGWPGTLTIVNKRNDVPNNPAAPGIPVGVLFSQTYLTILAPLVSYVGVGNASDYNTFPFVALEVTQTKIPCSNGAGAAGTVMDPTGQFPVTVGALGTDWRGNAIKFATTLVVVPANATAISAGAVWNGSNGANPQLGPILQMDGQRIAFAPPADGAGAASSSYSADSTSFETASFYLSLNPPSTPMNGAAPASQLVPMAKNITLAVEAVRHLQSSAGAGTPSGSAMYDYDQVLYAKNGFSGNPNEIFLTLSSGVAANSPPPGPTIDFTKNSAQSGGLAAPALGASALSRSVGILSGSVAQAAATSAPAGASLYSGAFNPADFFSGFNPLLFGFVPLVAIIQGVETAASQFMPKAITKELSNAEAFLEKAMALYDLLSSLVSSASGGDAALGGAAGPLQSILAQVEADLAAYSQLAQGIVPPGGAVAGGLSVAQGAPITNAQIQAAAWLESAATQAHALIGGYVSSLTTIFKAATAVYDDITGNTPNGLDFGALLNSGGTGDLQTFISAVDGFITQVQGLTSAGSEDAGVLPGPQSAAGAVLKYFGPVLRPLQKALSDVNAFFSAVGGGLQSLLADLAILSQGLDLAKSMSVEFKWNPLISGLEANQVVAFVPSSNKAFSLDILVNANSNNATPAGANITMRLDSFAICFGQGINQTPGAPVWAVGPVSASPIGCGYTQMEQSTDVSLVFDHMQVQMLAGQKPDVDVTFSDIYFGGDLAFVETLKNLIPLDAFSDPPFINVTSSGISAGFSLGVPNVAVGMFSIQNLNISASLSIPFISTGTKGITFNFGFCSMDNPFVVTVAMLGGGGFFTMTMGMDGLEGVAMGVQVEAQLAVDLVVASGSVSIEAGIFLVYWLESSSATDPVTGQPEAKGWLIGGYLRLRGEVDVCGIITISIELYLQITYSPTTGKCVASGFIAIDVSLFCFSISAQVPFSRTFEGSNGDPTFADLMSPGGVDPMLDPTLLSLSAATTWDPFTEYCMAYA